VTGGDPTGRYVVGRSYGSDMKVWLWDDGTPTQVPVPGDDERLADVNQNGVGVGFSYSGGTVTPYVYVAGKVKPLGGVPSGEAVAINVQGVIVGNDGATGRPVRWQSPTSTATPMPFPGGVTARVTDIGDDGTAVGDVGDRPYAWAPDGTGRYLSMPKGLTSNKAEFLQISGAWVIGRTIVGGTEIGLRWHLPTGQATEVRQFADRPSRVNAQGWMTGFDAQHRAILVTPAGTTIMPDLSTHRAGSFANMPNAMSDDGRMIAGDALDKRIGDNLAVRWICK
jgi:hypothetical protein